MLAIAAIGVIAFWAVVQMTHRRFLAGTQESVTGSARRGQAAPRAGSTRFRAGLARTVLVKEWRMILRDPQVITQTLMQVLYMLPMVFLAARHGDRTLALVVPAFVYLATILASNIAWLTVAAEDAPDLLGSAPVPLARLRGLKLLAALLPVWLLASPLIAFLAWAHPLDGLILLVCLAGGTTSVGAAQVWYPRQGKRADMKKRMQGHGMLAVLELLLSGGWVGLAWCLGAALPWTPVPLGVVAAVSGTIWRLGRSRRESAA
jgi:ABC-2 type transport system permease protein